MQRIILNVKSGIKGLSRLILAEIHLAFPLTVLILYNWELDFIFFILNNQAKNG